MRKQRYNVRLRRKKNLTFSEKTSLEKERVQSKGAPKKVGVGLKRKRELNKRRWAGGLAWWGSTETKQASHMLGLRGRRHYSNQRSSEIRAPCVASTALGTEGEEDQTRQIVSIKKATYGRRQRSRKIIDEERE